MQHVYQTSRRRIRCASRHGAGPGKTTTFFETDVMSGVRLVRNYIRGYSRQPGCIVFVSSESAADRLVSSAVVGGITGTALRVNDGGVWSIA
jgi:hypothetical protein